MYGEMPVIKIGKYSISEMSDKENEDSVWLQNEETGNGWQFRKEHLFPVIDEFYQKHF